VLAGVVHAWWLQQYDASPIGLNGLVMHPEPSPYLLLSVSVCVSAMDVPMVWLDWMMTTAKCEIVLGE